MRRAGASGTVVCVSEQLIERDEVVALLFNVSDIAELLRALVAWREETMAKRKRLSDEQRAFLDHVRVNAERTRKLAEKAQAELDRRKQERESA